MGIFTRFKDIIASNINHMLDNAEDPEKLIKLVIREMEDTLIELKSSCAGTIANQKKVQRILDEIQDKETFWEEKAQLAVNKGKDDLARQALQEKRKFTIRKDKVSQEADELTAITDQYRSDIQELEEKLKSAREKQRMLTQRHIRARQKKKARQEIRRAGSADVLQKFDELENHIERMEAEAELVDYGKPSGLEEEFERLESDDEIEAELARIKQSEEAGQ